MRIAILAVILLLLLGPSLRSSAAAPIIATLSPTPAYPRAGGTVRVERQADRVALAFELRGLATDRPAPPRGAAWPTGPVYVVWLADPERRLYNLGALPVDSAGTAASTLTPFIDPPAGSVLAISAEPRADLAAPTAPHDTVILSATLAGGVAPHTNRLSADLGPDWFAPIIPATLGLILLRHAARTHRAELRARRPATPLPSPPPA